MARSIWKGPFINFTALLKKKKIWSRNTLILPSFIGNTYRVYNGKKFLTVRVVQDMVGHKLGEFALTRQTKPKTKK